MAAQQDNNYDALSFARQLGLLPLLQARAAGQ